MPASFEPVDEPSILLVEDDARTRALLEQGLSESDYRVTAVGRADAASAALRSREFSAVVLDLGLPDGDGVDLCRRWRDAGSRMPILILTARSGVSSRVEGLDAGADDYLEKPFALSELRARLRALLRRGGSSPRERIFCRGDLVVDFGRRTALHGGTEIPITRRELEVLERLVRAKGHAVLRDDILDEIWGEASAETAASLEVIIARLRKKLDTPGGEALIRTIRGHGYALSPAGSEGEP